MQKTLPLRIYPQYMRKPPMVQQEHLRYIPRIAKTSKISNPGYKRIEKEEIRKGEIRKWLCDEGI